MLVAVGTFADSCWFFVHQQLTSFISAPVSAKHLQTTADTLAEGILPSQHLFSLKGPERDYAVGTSITNGHRFNYKLESYGVLNLLQWLPFISARPSSHCVHISSGFEIGNITYKNQLPMVLNDYLWIPMVVIDFRWLSDDFPWLLKASQQIFAENSINFQPRSMTFTTYV